MATGASACAIALIVPPVLADIVWARAFRTRVPETFLVCQGLSAMTSEVRETGVHIEMLGRFRVVVGRDDVAADDWPGRRAAELVALLALADGHRLSRDQVVEALWPHLGVEAGGANLRKAAHHARQALGSPEAVVLRGGQVALFPSSPVETDAARFEAQAHAALAGGDAAACTAAAAAYTGDLLPEGLYEEWTQAPRERLRSRWVELLRRGGQWERLVEVEPTDEPAYRELMRRELAVGSRPAAIRWYGRLRTALRRELQILPSAETEAIYDECVAGLALSEPTLVGRQLELARATALVRSEPGAELGALVVRGPAGIGKSAFCREVARVARAEGWIVIAVGATEAGGPYAPLASVVEQLVVRDRALLDAVGRRGRSVLAELTSLATPAATLEIPLTRHQVIGAFRRLLLAAADGAPVALVVDDAHLADEATIDALHHLGSASGSPVLVVLAYRPEAAPDALTRGVARLARGGKVVDIALEPLDREDAAALVLASAPTPRAAEVVDRIVDLAQGNPFLTLELARSPVAGVPALVATARDAVASRFLDLDEGMLAMLRRLALVGDDLDPASVVALTGSSEAEAFALLDVALRAGALVVSGAHYRFRHELVRQALVDQLAPHQRLVVHRDTARRLGGADAAPGVIARHWLEGGRPDEAVDWLLTAARQAVKLGAFADALAHLERVLDHEPDHDDALCLRAEALDAVGDPGAPAAYAAAARVVGEPGAQELRAKQALAQIKLGDPPGGLQVLEGVRPTTVDGRLAQALALSGAAALGFGDPKLGTAKAAEARRLALQSGDPAAVAVASWAQAAAAHARGELRSSVRADLRETHALPKLAVSVFDGQLCITQRLLYGARPYPDVIAFADSLAAEAQRLGAARGRAFAVTIRGEAKLLAGELDAADDDLAAGAELHRAIGAASGEAFALQRRAEVALHRGLHAEAGALLDEALAVARESDVGFHLLDRIYGTRVAAAADPASALAALEEAEAAVRGPVETCPGCRITLAVPAAIAAARAGDLERLAHWEQAVDYLATVVMRLPAWYAALDEVRGHRAQASADVDSAHDCFQAAAAGFGASGQPLDEARCSALARSAIG
jgi:DNA-binding SARP family transcriptional activator/tetratricopeptide (TPR) repeat protein